jgi:hypothetical protein
VCFVLVDNSSRYPVSQKEYTQKTGRLLAHRIGQILQQLGYRTWICKGQKNGVDLKVYDLNGNLILVAEILNWSCRSNLPEERKAWIIENLSEYPCNKLLIYTAVENEGMLDDLSTYGISTLKLEDQILPKFFYHHFERKCQIVNRKIDSKETSLQIKLKLKEYLQSLRLENLVLNADIEIDTNNGVFSEQSSSSM